MARTYESEDRLQQKMHIWFWNEYPKLRGLLFAVPNGGARSAREGRLFKETGVIRGVSDMILIYGGTCYCFENKTVVGVQSEYQEAWEKSVSAQGVQYFIIRDVEVFKQIIKSIIK